MGIQFYIDKTLRKIRYDLLLKLERLKKGNPIAEIKIPGAQYPIYLRKQSSDVDTFYQIYYYKGYDIKFAFEPKIIVDCGANVGLATVYFKNQYPNATIISVEPEQSNFDMLVKNTAPYKDIHRLRMGIWNKTTNLKIHDNGIGHWGFITEEVDYEDKDTVKAISIDGIMEKYGLDHIDVLKIDIETSEKELFEKNFEKWLPKVKVLLIELHDHTKEGCTRSFFKAMVNYRFTMRYKGENVICELLQ
jgi:FkbM family methyltransferase